jgi:hypothetical protein
MGLDWLFAIRSQASKGVIKPTPPSILRSMNMGNRLTTITCFTTPRLEALQDGWLPRHPSMLDQVLKSLYIEDAAYLAASEKHNH